MYAKNLGRVPMLKSVLAITIVSTWLSHVMQRTLRNVELRAESI